LYVFIDFNFIINRVAKLIVRTFFILDKVN